MEMAARRAIALPVDELPNLVVLLFRDSRPIHEDRIHSETLRTVTNSLADEAGTAKSSQEINVSKDWNEISGQAGLGAAKRMVASSVGRDQSANSFIASSAGLSVDPYSSVNRSRTPSVCIARSQRSVSAALY